MSTQTAWPHLLADLIAKRDALTTIIDTIRTQFIGDTPGEMLDSAAVPAPRAGKARSAERGRTNERTNERSKAHASSAEPP